MDNIYREIEDTIKRPLTGIEKLSIDIDCKAARIMNTGNIEDLKKIRH